MPSIVEIRQQYPQYQDISDMELGQKLHQKFYSDMSFDDFAGRVGLAPETNLNGAEAGIIGAAQGATAGWGDELWQNALAGGAFALDKLGASDNNKSFTEYKDIIRAQDDAALRDAAQNHTGAFIAGNVAGALGTGLAGGATKAGAAVNNFLRSGNVLTRVAKGAATGGASGGLYGAGAAEEGRRIEGAKEGAAIGAITGGVLPVAGSLAKSGVEGAKNVYRGATARNIDEIAQDAAQGLKSAGSIRSEMQSLGATIAPKKTLDLAKDLQSSLKEIDLIPELSPKTSAIVNRIKKASKSKKGISLNKLDQYRRLLRSAHGEDTVAAGAVRRAIDKAVNGLEDGDFVSGGKRAVELLNDFRREYTQAAKFEDVSDVLVRAGGDPNKIKSGLTRFLANKDNTRGWSEDEIRALQEAARNTFGEGLAKSLGKFGFDVGNSVSFGNTALPAASAYLGAAPLTAAGTGARMLQKGLARGKAENLLRTIEGATSGKSVNLPSLPGNAVSLPAGAANIRGAITSEPQVAIPTASTAARTVKPRLPVLSEIMADQSGSVPRVSIQYNSGDIDDSRAIQKYLKTAWKDKVSHNKETGRTVKFNARGINKALTPHTSEHERAISYRIPDLLNSAKFSQKRTPDEKTDPRGTKFMWEYTNDADVNGQAYSVKMLVRETNEGDFFYDHHAINKKEPASTVGATKNVPTTTGSINNIPDLSSNVNPPPGILSRIAQAESSGDPNAQAPTSTASGLFQFTDPTWQSTVRKYGREYGVKMQDKANPDAQRKMAGALMQEHREALGKSLKREPTEGELYLAHFAGSGGAKRLLKAPENAPAARILPKAALANRSIFYDGKRMRTVGEVINLITEKV